LERQHCKFSQSVIRRIRAHLNIRCGGFSFDSSFDMAAKQPRSITNPTPTLVRILMRRFLAACLLLLLVGCGDKVKDYDTAQLEEKQFNRPRATRLYRQIVEKYPDSPYANQARKTRLAELEKARLAFITKPWLKPRRKAAANEVAGPQEPLDVKGASCNSLVILRAARPKSFRFEVCRASQQRTVGYFSANKQFAESQDSRNLPPLTTARPPAVL
jgi:hypothetical protein